MFLQKYHKVWLEGHPEYDEWWLSQALAAGFDIHHLDEDHDNDDFGNLILVEKRDHSKLHGKMSASAIESRNRWENARERISIGEKAYTIRVEEGYTWTKIGEMLGYSAYSGTRATTLAAYYAKHNKKEWPIPHRENCDCSHCRAKRNKQKKSAEENG